MHLFRVPISFKRLLTETRTEKMSGFGIRPDEGKVPVNQGNFYIVLVIETPSLGTTIRLPRFKN